MMSKDITVVDTDYVILLRAGQALEVPIKYLIVKNPPNDQLLSYTIRQGDIEDVFETIFDHDEDPQYLLDLGVDIDDVIYVIATKARSEIRAKEMFNKIEELRGRDYPSQDSIQRKQREIDKLFNDEKNQLEYYNGLIEQILSSPAVCPFTPLIIKSKQKYYEYTLQDNKVDVTEFFSRVQLSSEVVYVQYNSGELNLIKIDPQSNYQHIEDTSEDKHLYVIVLFGEGKIIIDLDTTTLIATAKLFDPIDECDDKVVQILELIFGEEGQIQATAETNVSGESLLFLTKTPLNYINVGDKIEYDDSEIQIYDYLLKYLLTSRPEISEFLYFNERTKLLETKKKIPIYLRSPKTGTEQDFKNNRPSVVANLITDRLVTDVELNLENAAQHVGTLRRDTHFVEINIERADNEALAQLYIRMLSYVFGQYVASFNENFQEMYDYFEGLVPEMSQDLYDTLQQSHLLGSSDRKDYIESFPGAVIGYGPNDLTPAQLKNRGKFLFETFPTIFPEGYSREMAQPESKPLIIPESKIGEWTERQSLYFPRDEPLFHFVCPDEEYSYPGVRVNKLKSNRDAYPFLPRCFKKDQMHPGTNTYEYYKGKGKQIDKERRQVTATKIARYLQEAKIDPKIEELFDVSMMRIGTRKSPKSVIHCLLLATNDKAYIGKSEDQQAQFVDEWAAKLPNYTEVCRQEYFNYSNDQIRTILTSIDVVDTKTVFRALEELFNVNIYVIVSGRANKNLNISFEIPMFKEYHLRVNDPQRRTILLYKHEADDNNDLDWPQYEIVKFNNKYFTTELELVRRLFAQCLDFKNVDGNQIQPIIIDEFEIISQHINSDGRVDWINVSANGIQFTIIGVLHPPYNIPETNTMIYSDSQMKLPFERFVANAIDDSGVCVGKWFKYRNSNSMEILICVPCKKFKPDPQIMNKQAPQLVIESISYELIRAQNEYENLHALNLEILEWFVKVSAKFEPDINIADIIEVGETQYDTSSFQGDLGNVTTIKECFDYLRLYYTSFVDPVDDKIIVHSETYRTGLIEIIMKMYQRLPQNPDLIEIPKQIKSFQTQLIRQFAKTNELIFESKSDLNKWVKTKSMYASKRRTDSLTKLSVQLSNEFQPVVYFDGSDLFLIVNTFEGSKSLNQAHAIAKNWYLNKFVLTDFSDIEPTNLDEINIYYIDIDGDLAYTDNDSTKALNILQYSSNQYAAILKLEENL